MDPLFVERAKTALDVLEREENIFILLAVESGSRAWGFPSRDSDYDVRFVYVRTLDDYLKISPPRDVIERPVDALMDLGGWDLKKALGLMVKSNAVIYEWLSSPFTYSTDPVVLKELKELASVAAHLPAFAYHYDHLARRSWTDRDEPIKLKSYFYALRPALALLWMREQKTPPPMDLPSLLEGVSVTDSVHEHMGELLRVKADATEDDAIIERQPVLDRFLRDALLEKAPRPTWDNEAAREAADVVFRRIVLDY